MIDLRAERDEAFRLRPHEIDAVTADRKRRDRAARKAKKAAKAVRKSRRSNR